MKKITLLLASIGLFTFSSQAQITTFPHSEDFETFNNCPGSCGAVCNLTNGWTNPGVRDFTVDNNGTSSNQTGPTANGGADHNPGVSGGKYLLL